MSTTYNYLEAVTEDVKEYIDENINAADFADRDELEEHLNNVLWDCDSVTGNGSGSYTFNAYKAEKYLCHNWGILADAFEEFGSNTDILRQGAEACDVTIRCYLLGQAITQALDELAENLKFADEEQ